MLGNLIELCEESIKALQLLNIQKLISDEELRKQLEKKILLIQENNQTLSS
ncbi:MAG TPA: hypothetical protein VFC79_13890 [Tissierellaceae bacterium]|nr:hypothetical protein [Tissierellaceae bacterium]